MTSTGTGRSSKVAAWLIPLVFLFLIAAHFLRHEIRKIVTLMIFLSPAELGLATPLAMIAAIARAARSGPDQGRHLPGDAGQGRRDGVRQDRHADSQPAQMVEIRAGAGIEEAELLRLAAAVDRLYVGVGVGVGVVRTCWSSSIRSSCCGSVSRAPECPRRTSQLDRAVAALDLVVRQQRRSRAFVHDLALVQDVRAVRDRERPLDVLFHQQDGRALALHP